MSENKAIAQSFGDMIAVSNRPRRGVLTKKEDRSGLTMISEENREHMLEAMAQIHCHNVEFGSYECYGETKAGLCVDWCLVPEINHLNDAEGIRTVGCCCGHGKQEGYIQVAPEWITKMNELGYEQLPLDEDGNGSWCFKPKTSLPKAKSITEYQQLAPIFEFEKQNEEIRKLKEYIEVLKIENFELNKKQEEKKEEYKMQKIRIIETMPEYPVIREGDTLGERIGVLHKHDGKYVFTVDYEIRGLTLNRTDLLDICSKLKALNNIEYLNNAE